MDSSYKRNIECFGKLLFRILGMCFLLCLLIIVFNLMSRSSMERMKSSLQFISWYAEVYIILVFNVSFFTSYLPVILSFNTIRKSIFKARLTLNLIIILISVGINIGILSINNKLHAANIFLAISMYLLILGISNLMGILIVKYGKRGYLAFILVGGICGGICGGFSSAIFSAVKNNIFIISLSIISILIFAISSYFELITLKKYEIK